MKIRLMLPLLVGIVALSAIASAQPELPTLASLPHGEWTMIEPGGDTICSNGTPYSFFARPADTPTDKLLIHFQGGGACWNSLTCDPNAVPTYDMTVDSSDSPENYDGIFNVSNGENPFIDYNMVMVSYCTGDVHIGNTDTVYETGRGDLTIHHQGMTNAMSTLDWVFDNVEEPETVFMTGCSAGAIPTPYYTQFVAEQYPHSRIEALSDSAGGYRSPQLSGNVFDPWGTISGLPENYADFTDDTLSFEDFYLQSATRYPGITFTQFNHANDEVQAFFLGLLGTRRFELRDLLLQNFDTIRNAAPDNFYTYLSGGSGHCVTPTPDFYTYRVGETRLVDWVRDLATGAPMQDVICTDCTREERRPS